jgi:hypothetical protein
MAAEAWLLLLAQSSGHGSAPARCCVSSFPRANSMLRQTAAIRAKRQRRRGTGAAADESVACP